jgi:hypothetical protein
MDTELPCLIAAGCDDASLIAAYGYGFSLESRIVPDLNGNEKGIQIEMCDRWERAAHGVKVMAAVNVQR